MTDYSFGARLKAAREARGMTQDELADCTEFEVGFIMHHESRDFKKFSVSTIQKFCAALNVTSDYLFGLSDEMEGLNPIEMGDWVTLSESTKSVTQVMRLCDQGCLMRTVIHPTGAVSLAYVPLNFDDFETKETT